MAGDGQTRRKPRHTHHIKSFVIESYSTETRNWLSVLASHLQSCDRDMKKQNIHNVNIISAALDVADIHDIIVPEPQDRPSALMVRRLPDPAEPSLGHKLLRCQLATWASTLDQYIMHVYNGGAWEPRHRIKVRALVELITNHSVSMLGTLIMRRLLTLCKVSVSLTV